MIVSATVFEWFVVGMVAFIAIFTASRDAVILTRLSRKKDLTPGDRDLRFGTIIGIAICLYGLFGLFKHYYL